MAQKGAKILSSIAGNKIIDLRLGFRSTKRQQSIPVPYNNEGMLPSRSSSATWTIIFGKIWTTHKNLGFSSTTSKG